MNKPNFMKYYLNFHVETIVSKINLHNAQNFNNLNIHISRLTAFQNKHSNRVHFLEVSCI